MLTQDSSQRSPSESSPSHSTSTSNGLPRRPSCLRTAMMRRTAHRPPSSASRPARTGSMATRCRTSLLERCTSCLRRFTRCGSHLGSISSRTTSVRFSRRGSARRVASCAQFLMRAQDHSVRFRSVTDGTRQLAQQQQPSSTGNSKRETVRPRVLVAPTSRGELGAWLGAAAAHADRRTHHTGCVLAPPRDTRQRHRRHPGTWVGGPRGVRPRAAPDAPQPPSPPPARLGTAYYLPRQSDGSVPYNLCAPGRWPPLSLAH